MSFEFFTSASTLDQVFWVFALVGSFFLIIRLILLFMGLDTDFDFDIDMSEDGNSQFGIFSINTVTAFFTIFGWTGLTCHLQYSMGVTQSIVIASLAGLLAMLMTISLLKQVKKMTSKGAQFHIKETIGLKAKVTERIFKDGRGVVSLSVGGMTHAIEAVSMNGEMIDSFQTVEIMSLIDGSTVSVKRV